MRKCLRPRLSITNKEDSAEACRRRREVPGKAEERNMKIQYKFMLAVKQSVTQGMRCSPRSWIWA